MKPVDFEEKSMMMLQHKKGGPSKSLWNLSFLNDFDDNEAQKEVTHYKILSMAAATARLWGPSDEGPKWRSKQFWAWLQPQQNWEVQAMRKESRFWTALQFGWKVPTLSLEGKTDAPQWIGRLRARTPCCKQLFGESAIQSFNFLSRSFLSGSWPVRAAVERHQQQGSSTRCQNRFHLQLRNFVPLSDD